LKEPWAVVLLLLPLAAAAQEKPPLRWGTDPTGGAPYVHRDAAGRFIGFEVELADYLAGKLGRASAMRTGDWDKLPELLGRPADENGIDIVLNGYELTEDLEKQYPSTIPYYIYRLALVINKDDAGKIVGWTDLVRKKRNGERHTIGVLGGSSAHNYMKSDRFSDAVELKINPDVVTVIGLVETKRLDATVQDTPAAQYYVKRSPSLVIADEPRKQGFYVILTRPKDKEIREQLNAALRAGIRDGTLESIYRKYGVWNADQERLRYWTEKPWPPPFEAAAGIVEEKAKANWGRMLGELLRACGMTVFLSLTSFPLAMGIGLLVALGRIYGPRWLAILLGGYVEIIRGTPLLLQLYFVFYLLPQEVSWFALLTPLQAGIMGLAINYSAYEAENYRAGLLAIPRGQMEAALALGMSPLTAILRIVTPQALRLVIPPVTNDFIALFKDTSVCSVILITELTRKYNELYNFNREYISELAFITAGLYLVMSYPLALLARRLEKRMAIQALP
jgi:polar amino acid transport system substrate-binding protein